MLFYQTVKIIFSYNSFIDRVITLVKSSKLFILSKDLVGSLIIVHVFF
jgi:hypothetical protein